MAHASTSFDAIGGPRRRGGAAQGLPAATLALAILLGCTLALTAHAQTMYKCQNASGRIEYSDRPCWSGAEVKRMTPTGGPTQEDVECARMRAAGEQQRAAEQKRQAAQERLAGQTPAPATGAGATTGASAVRDPGNDKVLTHDRSGWDRKPQGQVAAEEAAREQGRERARAGAANAGKVSADGQGSWGQEKTLTHSRTGWDTPTRSGQVQAEADRAYRNEKARLSAPAMPNPAAVVPSPAAPGPAVVTTCDAGGCWDASGRRYTSSGSSLVRNDGRVCQQVGSTLTCN